MPKSITPQINWNNPITNGLVIDIPFFERGGMTPMEITQKIKGSENNGPIPWQSTLFGTSKFFTSSSSQWIRFNQTGAAVINNFSVEILCIPNKVATNQLFATRVGGIGPGEHSFDIQLSATGFHGDIGDGTNWLNTSLDATYTYAANKPLQVVYTITPTGAVIYANGGMVTTGTTGTAPMLYDSAHNIGIGSDGNQGGNGYFDGNVIYVRLWKRVISATEVKRLYTAPFSIYRNSIQPGMNTGVFR